MRNHRNEFFGFLLLAGMFIAGAPVVAAEYRSLEGVAGLDVEPGVELEAVAGQSGQVLGGPELTDEAGGVPRRTAGELMPLQHEDVVHAEQGEVVGDGAAHHPATDDDHLGPRGQLPAAVSHGPSCSRGLGSS